MEAMGLIAIIVNCYLIGQCGQLQRLFPWLSPEMAIISIVILEVRQPCSALSRPVETDRSQPSSQSEMSRVRRFSAACKSHVSWTRRDPP